MKENRAAVDASFSSWIKGEEGRRYLEKRMVQASCVILEDGAGPRLAEELQALIQPGSRDFRFGSSLWRFCAELPVLCLAESCGIGIPEKVWKVVLQDWMPPLLAIDEINFQGRTNNPPWHSDLSTSELGVNLTLALHLDRSGRMEAAGLEAFLREKCLKPILADWLDHGTRLHSLDTMGHNWWSVMVGGAGIMAVLLDDQAAARRICGELYRWFHYQGNILSRKRRNFGAEGDFVECFHYADYAMYHPVAFARLHPDFRLVPDALDGRQIRGLASWFKKSILTTGKGYPQQRFGDIQFFDGFMGPVWQTLAKAAGDDELMGLAYRLRPEPRYVLEMLFWEACPPDLSPASPKQDLEVFPHSGMAFVRHDHLCLTVRAGDFWGHTHLDAGSFVFHQDGVIWIDDSGACEYGRQDYPEYYVSAAAHNVAYVPELAPPSRRAHYEGLPSAARYLLQADEGLLKILCADTGILSGTALARSYRWFLELGGEAVVVWDDLAAYQNQRFSFLLHSATELKSAGGGNAVLSNKEKQCPLFFYSSVESRRSVETAPMGQLSGKGVKPFIDMEGKSIVWNTEPVSRVKFGLVLGTRIRSQQWNEEDPEGGVECVVETEKRCWRIRFNPRADGRVMHENCRVILGGYETDAYALVHFEEAGRQHLGVVEGSYVRRDGSLLWGSLERKTAGIVLEKRRIHEPESTG